MFREAFLFDGDVSMIDTSNVTNMAAMFRNAKTFDQDISHFDTTNTTNMSNMFRGADRFNGDISQWNTAVVASMDNMFNDADRFNQNLAGWCVPLIASLPTNFDTNSAFAGNTAKQPPWGGCPADFTIDTDVVIGTPTGASPVLYTTVVSIATAATTTPASVPVLSNQWQRSTDGGTTWTDIDNATATTYTVIGSDRNAQIRLTQRLQNGGTSPVITSLSNALTVENTSPPPASYNEGDILAFDADTNGYIGSIVHGSGRFWTIPYDSEYTVGTNVNDLTDSISYELPAEIGSSITFAFGGGTILPDGRILWVNYNSTKLCIFDPDAATTADRFHVFDASIGGSGNFGFNSVVVSSLNNKAYGIPYLSGAIMSVDYINETSTTFFFTGGIQYFGGVEGPDQKIYMTPGNQKKLSIFDPSDSTVREITVPYVNTVGAYPIAGGATYVDSNNSIYIAPRNSNEIVKLDFNVLDANGDPTISLIDLSPTVPVSGKFYAKPQITADGFLVFAPEEASGSIVYLDLSDDSVAFYSNDFTSTGDYKHSLMLSDGRIILTPAGSPYKYGVIDTFSANPNDPLDLDTNYGQ
jgi:surface protein